MKPVLKTIYVIGLVIFTLGLRAQVNVGFSGGKGSYTFSKTFKTIKDIPRFSEWDSLPNGKWIQLYEGGQLAMEYTMKNHLLNGTVKGYYPDGSLRYQFTMNGNYIDGIFKEYYTGGKQIWRLFTYFEGFMNGPWYMYYEDGTKRAEGEHINDRKTGKLYQWYPDGKMKEERTYKNDTLNGLTIFWYENGNMQMKGDQFTDDKKVGKWEFWYEDGTKHKDSEFIGDLEMVHNAWNRKGQVMVENGEGKYIYVNQLGVKLMEGLYSKSLQHGKWLYWDEKDPSKQPREIFYLNGKKQK